MLLNAATSLAKIEHGRARLQAAETRLNRTTAELGEDMLAQEEIGAKDRDGVAHIEPPVAFEPFESRERRLDVQPASDPRPNR